MVRTTGAVAGGPALPVRDDLRGETPYGAPQLDVPVRLNTNENPFPPSAALVADVAAAVADATTALNRYPDRDAVALRSDLAAYLQHDTGVLLGVENVWAANGSNEVMQQVMQAFGGPGRSVLAFTPTYAMYPSYCRDTFTRYVTEPSSRDFGLSVDLVADAVLRHRPTVVILGSPNNPTGTALDPRVLQATLAAAPGLVLVDEAYAEFRRPGAGSAVELVAEHPNLVVTRTMSKAFGLAGARVGYLASSPAVVDAVQLVRLPYHLSSVTQAVARTALRHTDALAGQLALLRSERDALVDWLRSAGSSVVDSDANFVLFGRFADRHRVWQGLLDRGVLVREVGPPEWLRVTVGTPEDNAAFRAAFQEVTS